MKPTALLGLCVAGAALLAMAARRAPEVSTQPSYEPVASPGSGLALDGDDDQPDESTPLAGEVKETFDVAQYTYLRLATANGETWAAVSKTAVRVGSHVQIDGATRMENFTSSTLKRTFPEIYFGSLGAGAGALPPGHPAVAGQDAPHPSPAASAGAETLPLARVPRAPGPTGRTIAELYAQQGSLQDQHVRVSGQVTKVTAGVLGKNFLHLRDGSGDAQHSDLVVTTQAETSVGQVITLDGVLRRDVDVGIGYKYALLLEDASALPAL